MSGSSTSGPWWDERSAPPPVASTSGARLQPAPHLSAYVDLDCLYLRNLVLQALTRRPGWSVQAALSPAAAAEECTCPDGTTFFWGEYERTNWSAVLAGQQSSAAYCVRKGLIRKSNWAHNAKKWAAKRPESLLAGAVPQTLLFEFWDIDYIEEALADVYEVRDMAADGSEWWLLKPSMTNQGRGIVVFNKLETLVSALSQEGADEVREWVLQRYIRRPLLCGGRKFHLRAYALAVGALTVYVYSDVLTLSSLCAYDDNNPANLAAHITNTCCQGATTDAEVAAAVGLLRDLPARLVADGSVSAEEATGKCARVFADCATLIGEAFAAVSSELSFLPLDRSFELYGFDLLVDADWHVWLIEANAEPDFAQTGDALQAVVAGVVEGALALSLDVWHPGCAAQQAAAGYAKVFERQDPRAAGSAMTFA